MKIPLTIIGVVLILLLGFYIIAPKPGPDVMQSRTDLPWQISVNPDGSSRVLDIELGSATLADAMEKFGGVEGLAVFETEDGAFSLEAFFGTVPFGPLTAKIIVRLAVAEDELQALIDRASGREGSPSGDWKYPLNDNPRDHSARLVKGISYIPGTRNLDPGFIRERFGAPAATLRENEHAVSWFYPDRGLSILIDDKAREVLEYQAPRDFTLPAQAEHPPG